MSEYVTYLATLLHLLALVLFVCVVMMLVAALVMLIGLVIDARAPSRSRRRDDGWLRDVWRVYLRYMMTVVVLVMAALYAACHYCADVLGWFWWLTLR